MKVLIINVHSSKNAGDRAILEASLKHIRTEFGESDISICTNWPQEDWAFTTAKIVPSIWWLVGNTQCKPIWRQLINSLRWYLFGLLAGADILVPKSWRSTLQAYRDADVVIAIGGNQFYSTGKWGWPFPLTVLGTWMANRFRKPLYVLPQSIGPLRRGWERALLRRIYGRARLVYLRDQISLDLANEIGFPKQIIRDAPDSAFDFSFESTAVAQTILMKYGYQDGQKTIGMTVIGWMGRSLDKIQVENYYSVCAAVCSRLIEEKGVDIYMFNQVTGPTEIENDANGAQEVLQRMKSLQGMHLVNEVLPPDILKSCYGKMDLMIASRLHSGIFSLGMHVPTVFMGYLSKTRGILRVLGLEEWGLDIQDMTDSSFFHLVNNAWEQRIAYRKQLEALMPVVAAQSREAVHAIKADYQSIKTS